MPVPVRRKVLPINTVHHRNISIKIIIADELKKYPQSAAGPEHRIFTGGNSERELINVV